MKKQRRFLRIALFVLVASGSFTSCQTVKQYQKMYVNDSEMTLSSRKVEKLENSFLLYREGASGANGGKSGGGCVCN